MRRLLAGVTPSRSLAVADAEHGQAVWAAPHVRIAEVRSYSVTHETIDRSGAPGPTRIGRRRHPVIHHHSPFCHLRSHSAPGMLRGDQSCEAVSTLRALPVPLDLRIESDSLVDK